MSCSDFIKVLPNNHNLNISGKNILVQTQSNVLYVILFFIQKEWMYVNSITNVGAAEPTKD